MVARWPAGDTGATPDTADLSAEAMAKAEATIELIQEVIGRIRAIRGEMDIPPGGKVDVELVSPDAERLAVLREGEHYIRSLVAVGELRLGPEPAIGGFASTAVFEDVTIRVILSEELRVRERTRMDKEIARLERGVADAEKKLANEKFLSGAPPKVVAAERERLERMREQLETLRTRRATLD
jgi:valyl-tRNA synthetase